MTRPRRRQSRDTRLVRHIAAGLALLLSAYCFIAAATALYADTNSGGPNPAELAARERYQWPGWIPIGFLALVVLYAIAIGARRRRRRGPASPSSTEGPPGATPPRPVRRDITSR